MGLHQRRIVVTGLGVIAPNGQTLETFWETILAGKVSAGRVSHFDASAMPCQMACEVARFDPTKFMAPSQAKRYDRSILFAVAAAKNAVADARLDLARVDHDRVGVAEGTSVSGLDNTLRAHTDFVTQGYKSIKPTRLVNAFCGGGASEIAIQLGFLGQATTIATACSSGNDALGYAARAIRDDLADVMIAGATEAPIVDGYYSIFAATGVMSRSNDDPAHAMRPFDRARDGFVLGEGAGFLVLEELSHALARGARIYCEWAGHGQSCDAHHTVALHPEGRGMKRAMEKAFLDASLTPAAVGYINAHASATEQNDEIETAAIKQIFGAHANRLVVSGTKPVTGHLMGATAGVEAAVCALALLHQVVPPTANHEKPSPGCDLDYAASGARQHKVETALNISHGFGGKCSALLLKRFRE